MFVIDSSNYLGEEHFKKVKHFIMSVVKYFRIAPSHVRVGSIIYSTSVKDNFNLNTYKDLQQVLRAIGRIPYRKGQEYTNLALNYVRRISFTEKYGSRPDVLHVAVIITNGEPNNLEKTSEEAGLLKKDNVKVFIVAIGDVYMKGEEKIASVPSNWFIVRVPNYEVLERYAWILAYRIYWGKII